MAWTTPRTWTDGELVTAAIMNAHVRDNLNASAPHLIVRKTSDQTVTSSVTLVSDTALIAPLAANEVWHLRWGILYSTAGVADIRIAFNASATLTYLAFRTAGMDNANAVSTPGWYLGAASGDTASTNFFSSENGTASPAYIEITGVVVAGAGASNITMKWAQGTSDASNTIVKTNSTVWGVKLA